ncbi:metabotropic glutamate receptor 8 [Trichonephila clavipes]|nr:metabotropic glutamate receptor 8 [Trichonephila clavipes]
MNRSGAVKIKFFLEMDRILSSKDSMSPSEILETDIAALNLSRNSEAENNNNLEPDAIASGSNCQQETPSRQTVFRSELIAIDEALRIIKTMTSPDEIWILCDSRSAIQHLSDWTNVGDKTSVSILKNLKELSQQHEIYFQWIPSHIGLFGNDTADLLAKEGVTENLMSRRTLTFSEIFLKRNL